MFAEGSELIKVVGDVIQVYDGPSASFGFTAASLGERLCVCPRIRAEDLPLAVGQRVAITGTWTGTQLAVLRADSVVVLPGPRKPR